MLIQKRLFPVLCLLILSTSFEACRTSPEAQEAKYIERGHALLAKKDYSRAILEFRNATKVMPKDAEPYYQIGLASIAAGDGSNAIRAFHKATELNPKHSGAQLKLAEFMTASGNEKVIREGVSRLQGVFGNSPDNPEAIDTLALAEWQLGKPEDASRRLDEALQKFPGHLQTSVALARMKLSAKDWHGAEDVLKKAVAEAPQSSPAALALGELYRALGQMPQAEIQFRRAVELDPKNGGALSELGAILIASKQFDQAEVIYRQLSALPDKQYEPLHAVFLYRFGSHEDAVKEFESLAKADPGDRVARTNLVIALVGTNRSAQAETILSAALKQSPKDTDALLQRAELRLRAGKAEEAEEDIRAVLHFSPESASAHFALAKIYRLKKLPDNERAELGQAVKLAPELLQVRLALEVSLLATNHASAALEVIDAAPEDQKHSLDWMIGRNWALLGAGNLPDAKAGIAKAVELGRTPRAVYQQAVLQFVQKDYASARVSLEELLKLEATDPVVAELFMETYARQQAVPKGIERLKAIAAEHPKSALLQQTLGQWSERAGDTAGARKAFEAAKAVNRSFLQADVSLAAMDARGGNNQAALQRLSGVIAADPKNANALLMSAEIQDAAGAHSTAISTYRAVLQIDGSNLIAMNNLAYDLVGQNPEEALKVAQQAADLAPASPNIQDTLGWIYYRKGMYSLAIRCLKIAVDTETNPRREFHLGMSYLRAGDQATGQKLVRDALQKDPELSKTEQGW